MKSGTPGKQEQLSLSTLRKLSLLYHFNVVLLNHLT